MEYWVCGRPRMTVIKHAEMYHADLFEAERAAKDIPRLEFQGCI